MSVPYPASFAFQTTNTAGTFAAFNLSAASVLAPDGVFLYRRFRDRLADGASVPYIRSQAVDSTHSMVYEACIGTLHYGSPDTITPVTGLESSSAPMGSSFIPIVWASGTQNVWSVPLAVITEGNVIAFLTANAVAIRAALALGTAAQVDTGAAAGKIPLLAAAGSGTLADLAMLSSLFSGQRFQLSTGGANNRVCRFVSYSAGVLTVTEANGITLSLTPDSPALLSALWCRGNDGVLYPPRSVVPFTGVTASTDYYLGNGGVLTSAAVPTSFDTIVRQGHGLAAGVLWFDPQPPVVAHVTGGLTLRLESNYWTA